MKNEIIKVICKPIYVQTVSRHNTYAKTDDFTSESAMFFTPMLDLLSRSFTSVG